MNWPFIIFTCSPVYDHKRTNGRKKSEWQKFIITLGLRRAVEMSQKGPGFDLPFLLFRLILVSFFFCRKTEKRDFGQQILSTERENPKSDVHIAVVIYCCAASKNWSRKPSKSLFYGEMQLWVCRKAKGTTKSESSMQSGKPHFNNIIKFQIISFSFLSTKICASGRSRLTVCNPARKFNLAKCILRSHNPGVGS